MLDVLPLGINAPVPTSLERLRETMNKSATSLTQGVMQTGGEASACWRVISLPSPFPGMDPYIEGHDWPNFHVGFIVALRDVLIPLVRPKYILQAERRIYLEKHLGDEEPQPLIPDLTVLHSSGQEGLTTSSERCGSKPIVLTLPMPEEERQTYLTVRLRGSLEVVTVIELLSPANKRRGSDGRKEYLEKRAAILQSRQHLVEIDLLRVGARLPTVEPLPYADYYVFVCRARQRPSVEVYAWSLRDPMPSIPIPLLKEDPDVSVDLQETFNELYDRTGYDYSLDYAAPPLPALSKTDERWARQFLGRP